MNTSTTPSLSGAPANSTTNAIYLQRFILGIGSGGADYSNLSDDGTTFYVGSYQTVFPYWPRLLQLSVTALPQLTSVGRGASGEFTFDLLGREGATYELQTRPTSTPGNHG
jgi:hypothetical protein